MDSGETTLFDSIGGATAVDRLIDDFYERVLGDPELRPFFEDTSMDKWRLMQKEFFAAALDGPVTRSDLELAHVHQGRGIKPYHFNLFAQHLLATLEEMGISDADRMEVIRRISTYVDDITGEAGASGD